MSGDVLHGGTENRVLPEVKMVGKQHILQEESCKNSTNTKPVKTWEAIFEHITASPWVCLTTQGHEVCSSASKPLTHPSGKLYADVASRSGKFDPRRMR
uniref:Uncharacterized protein n=1 Tax=Ciona intestinalis TaxID=7719 RepID=H2XXM1_CIOIN